MKRVPAIAAQLVVVVCVGLTGCQDFVLRPSQRPAGPIVPGNVDCGSFEEDLCHEILKVARQGLADSADDLDQSFLTVKIDAVPQQGECVSTRDCERRFAVVKFEFEDRPSMTLHVFRRDVSGELRVQFN